MTIYSERPAPLCAKCGERDAVKKGVSKHGYTIWRSVCSYCKEINKHPHRLHKKCKCELCGFVPQHPCQLDVDHIDGNPTNNSIENLQTLCANCHRLKTHINKESTNTSYRK